nr:uncharacterized protein LOC118682545 [Bactrocera oleae]
MSDVWMVSRPWKVVADGSTNVVLDDVRPLRGSANCQNYAWLSQRAILAAKNNDVQALSFTIQSKIAGDLVTYNSVDSITNPDDVVNYPTEFLNSLELPGFPPHNLQLKVGTVIMILRNLNPPRLCNGTRFSVKQTVIKFQAVKTAVIWLYPDAPREVEPALTFPLDVSENTST